MKRLAFALLLLGCGPAEEGTPDAGGGVQATFTSLYADYFQGCKQCHQPDAPGYVPPIELTLDFTSKATAYSTIKTGMASGLMGDQSVCNGVPFIDADPAKSLILAVLDEPTRQAFDLPAFSSCDMLTITDEAQKVGTDPSPAFIAALKQWISNGALNN